MDLTQETSASCRPTGGKILALSLACVAFTSTAQAAEQPAKCRVEAGSTQSTELTGKLDRCNGVLKPPKIGDSELVTPAPATGTMPVINPDQLTDTPQDKIPGKMEGTTSD